MPTTIKAKTTSKTNGKAKGRVKPSDNLPSQNQRGAIVKMKPNRTVPRKTNGRKAGLPVKPKNQLPSHPIEISGKGEATLAVKPSASLPALCQELQALQRQRVVYVKSRIMIANRLQAIVAGTMGYHAGMKEGERAKVFAEAGKLIKRVVRGELGPETDERCATITPLILTHNSAIAEFVNMQAAIEKELVATAKQLPTAEWVEQPEQRGFGVKFLGIVIGETGDLNNYPNPGKVWRRLGAAPWTFDGKTQMGSTWRRGKEGKLPSSEWEEFGYSPRRRSIMYLIGEGLMKQNTVGGGAGDTACETDRNDAGPYRLRYDVKKAELAAAHADDKLYPPIRCHLHGMLLAAKLLVKNLWIEWRA